VQIVKRIFIILKSVNSSVALIFSPDCSEKLFLRKAYFLLKKKSDRRKLFFILAKKGFHKKNLKRKAGKASNKRAPKPIILTLLII